MIDRSGRAFVPCTLATKELRFPLLCRRFVFKACPLGGVDLGLEDRPGLAFDGGRIDPARRLHTGNNVVPHNFGHEYPLKLGAKAAAGTGGIPNAEHQGGWTVPVHGRRMIRTRVSTRFAD